MAQAKKYQRNATIVFKNKELIIQHPDKTEEKIEKPIDAF